MVKALHDCTSRDKPIFFRFLFHSNIYEKTERIALGCAYLEEEWAKHNCQYNFLMIKKEKYIIIKNTI